MFRRITLTVAAVAVFAAGCQDGSVAEPAAGADSTVDETVLETTVPVDESAVWCSLLDELNPRIEAIDETDLRSVTDLYREVADRITDAAPSEIAGDAQVLAAETLGLVEAIEDADYKVTEIAFPDQTKFDAANEALDEYSFRECGVPFGTDPAEEDGTEEDEFISGESARDMMKREILTMFVMPESDADCIADAVAEQMEAAVAEGGTDALDAMDNEQAFIDALGGCGIAITDLVQR